MYLDFESLEHNVRGWLSSLGGLKFTNFIEKSGKRLVVVNIVRQKHAPPTNKKRVLNASPNTILSCKSDKAHAGGS